MIKNLVFDMGNVLISYDPDRFLKSFIADDGARRAVREALFEAPEWALSDMGTISPEDQLAAALRRCPRRGDDIRRAFESWHTDLPLIPGMAELLARLKARGYPLYLLSNFSGRFYALEGCEAVLDLLDGIVISSDVKMVKPDIRIYRLLLERFALDAGESLFIDDMPANVEGAAAVGMRARQFLGAADLETFLKANGVL